MVMEPISSDALRDAVSLAAEVTATHADTVDREGRYPTEAMEALGRLGLRRLLVPTAFGGSGGTLGEFVATVRRLARSCGSTALCYTMHVGSRHTLVARADDPHIAALLRTLCATDGLCTLAVSPARGPDGRRQPLTVGRTAAGYRLNGRMAWCTGAVAAAGLLVLATADAGDEGLTPVLLWIPLDEAAGVRVEPTWNATGMRGSRSDTVVFDNVVAPRTALISGEGQGGSLLAATDAPTLLGLAATSLGSGEAVLRSGWEALRQRLQPSDTPPPVALELAAAALGLQAAAAALDTAVAAAALSPAAARQSILAAKYLCNMAATTVADAALAAGGASAYQHGNVLERRWRDAHAGRLMLPTPDECRVIVARELLQWS